MSSSEKTATKPIPANNPMGKGTIRHYLKWLQKIEESPLHLLNPAPRVNPKVFSV
jgi:hypothetical protein